MPSLLVYSTQRGYSRSPDPSKWAFCIFQLCEGTVQKLTGHVAIMSNLIPNAADNRHLQLTIGLKNKIQDCRALIRVGGAKVAQEIIQYIVEILLEGLSPEVLQSTVHQQAAEHHTVPAQDIVVRFKDACVSVLSSFQDPKMFGMVAVFRVVMQTLMTNGGASSTTFPHIKASSFETFNVLIRSRMIVANVLDRMLSRIIDSTSSRDAIGLAQQLIKMFCVDDKITGLCGEVIALNMSSLVRFLFGTGSSLFCHKICPEFELVIQIISTVVQLEGELASAAIESTLYTDKGAFINLIYKKRI